MTEFKSSLFSISLAVLISACSVQQSAEPNTQDDIVITVPISDCEAENVSISDIQAMKVDEYKSLPKESSFIIAQTLLNCVGHPDPKIRDGVVFETITHILRSDHLSAEQVDTLKLGLLERLNSPDSNGFTQPFAALLLSEVARVDRISAFLNEEGRTQFVRQAAKYVTNVADYRGFSDDEGWRHGVAHGADWLMQLSLNPNLTAEDKNLIRSSVASQLMPQNHSYVFGESERLARPILFLAATQSYTQEEWAEWLKTISSPAPLNNWGEAFSSESDLARLHNLKAFTNAIYINASVSRNEGVKMLRPGSLDVLRTLP